VFILFFSLAATQDSFWSEPDFYSVKVFLIIALKTFETKNFKIQRELHPFLLFEVLEAGPVPCLPALLPSQLTPPNIDPTEYTQSGNCHLLSYTVFHHEGKNSPVR
jgi:hypothetical protein